MTRAADDKQAVGGVDRSLTSVLGTLAGVFIGAAGSLLSAGREPLFLGVVGALVVVFFIARQLRRLPPGAPLISYVSVGSLAVALVLLTASTKLPLTAANVALAAAGLSIVFALMITESAERLLSISMGVGAVAVSLAVVLIGEAALDADDPVGVPWVLAGVSGVCLGLGVLADINALTAISTMGYGVAGIGWGVVELNDQRFFAMAMICASVGIIGVGLGGRLLNERITPAALIVTGAGLAVAGACLLSDTVGMGGIAGVAGGVTLIIANVGQLTNVRWLRGIAFAIGGAGLFAGGIVAIVTSRVVPGVGLVIMGAAVSGVGVAALWLSDAGEAFREQWHRLVTGGPPQKPERPTNSRGT